MEFGLESEEGTRVSFFVVVSSIEQVDLKEMLRGSTSFLFLQPSSKG